jgi:hypothetical protein
MPHPREILDDSIRVAILQVVCLIVSVATIVAILIAVLVYDPLAR